MIPELSRGRPVAIRVVRPYGVDVCSGVRKDGRLDKGLLVAFLEAVSRPSAGF